MHNEGRADFFPVRQIDGTTGGHHNFNVEIPAVPAVPTQSQENQSLPPNASSPKTMTDIIVSVNGTLYGGCVVNGELGFPL